MSETVNIQQILSCVKSILSVGESKKILDKYALEAYLKYRFSAGDDYLWMNYDGYEIISEDSLLIKYQYGLNDLKGSFIHNIK